jgi:hypothetical protein
MRASWRTPVDGGAITGGFRDAAEDFEERALAGAVASDDADDFAALDVEGNVTEREELFGSRRSKVGRRRTDF